MLVGMLATPDAKGRGDHRPGSDPSAISQMRSDIDADQVS